MTKRERKYLSFRKFMKDPIGNISNYFCETKRLYYYFINQGEIKTTDIPLPPVTIQLTKDNYNQ